ncbi:sulfite exporter TauE/SafE family protein [Chitinophaga sp. Cy-1792]|uniref:sulfite exporter TauE/SafE family protein n=1 Tax=Chitinophaga sp. Cy-1792 TaxID=2608339 RepID=UPI00141E8FCC|nr:sulfite exporter TauE/SafE family protein [Chitinophaga sp. Cy-1792]NIG52463.1 sulfite exporter TauE/SafE family protein [Chitinophaga sp. Cy-1792]
MFTLTAFLLGFAGSFHCVGMCGPIALALPVQHLQGAKKLAGIFLYNAGRISVYSVFGLLFGWLGQQLFLGGFQQWLSVTAGLILLFSVLVNYVLSTRKFRLTTPGIMTTQVKAALGKLLVQQRFSTLYTIGVLNGLLPCGLVYMGITGAAATGTVEKGMLFMAAFGAGTLPAMAGAAWFGHLLSAGIRNKMRSLVPVMIAVMAILLIMRGMNLGIPYVSPVISQHPEKIMEHCFKP